MTHAEFERFDRGMAALRDKPYVCLLKRGSFSLNAAAIAALGYPGAVELLYDRHNGVVGLRAISVSAPHAQFVRRASSSPAGPWVVSAMAFTKFYDIDATVSRRWPAQLDDDILCIDISVEGDPVTSNRRARLAPPHNVSANSADSTAT